MELLASAVISLVIGFVFSTQLKDWIASISKKVSWHTFEKAVKDDKVLAILSEEKPDLIIGINDGVVPGSILARNLASDIIYWTVADGMVDTHGHEPDLKGKNVLLLDDQILTGTGMSAVLGHAQTLGDESSSFKRMVLFEYDTPTRKAPLDYTPPARTNGKIKMMPWSYSEKHKARYMSRNR